MTEFENIKVKLNEKETEELLDIWTKNKRDEWREKAFAAIQEILTERQVPLPEQRTFPPALPDQPGHDFSKDVGMPFFPTSTPPPAPQTYPAPEVSIEKPSLFWRRVTAVIVDLLFLHILVFVMNALTGTEIHGTLLAWVAFFGIWFTLHLKDGVSIGKLLVQVHTTRTEQLGEKSPLFMARFGLTWLPLLVMTLPASDPALVSSGDTSTFIQALQVLALVWYLAIFVSLIVTEGHRGLHDIIVRCVTNFKTRTFLSVPRKVLATLATVVLVCEISFAFFLIGSADSTRDPKKPGLGIPAYDRNARYNPEQIRALYQDRVFEVETLWQQPGGFLWRKTVEKGSNGSALMFLNNRKFGLLVSNWHVVAPSPKSTGGYHCRVRRSPQEDYAEVLVVAKGKYDCDIALVLLELGEGWEPSIVPTSPINELQAGEIAIAIGNAFGRGISVTDGLISMIEGNVGAQMIRTSTPISPGNSGGPLFLRRGALHAGVVVAQDATYRAQNINYAIPAEYMWNTNNWEFLVDDPSAIIAMLRGEVQ